MAAESRRKKREKRKKRKKTRGWNLHENAP
jgi:hypothetical protein